MKLPPEVAKVLAGERRYALVEGDSFRMLRELPADSVDLLLTDPPYSSGGMFRGDRTRRTDDKYTVREARGRHADFTGDTRDQRSFLAWMVLWLSEVHRVLRDGSPVCVFTDWRQLPTVTDALQAAGFIWRGIVPWDKVGARPTMGRFSAQCEYVVWGSRGQMPFERGVEPLPGLVRCHVDPKEKHHQTGKPVPMLRELLRIVRPDSVVLDPFMGAGSTGVACLADGCRFIGVELLRVNVDNARRRLAEAEVGRTTRRK